MEQLLSITSKKEKLIDLIKKKSNIKVTNKFIIQELINDGDLDDIIYKINNKRVTVLNSPINPKGYFKYYEFREQGKINNKECDWYVVYKGSSEYNRKEMSILLEGTNNDCKELGVETIEEYKMKKLIEEWE